MSDEKRKKITELKKIRNNRKNFVDHLDKIMEIIEKYKEDTQSLYEILDHIIRSDEVIENMICDILDDITEEREEERMLIFEAFDEEQWVEEDWDEDELDESFKINTLTIREEKIFSKLMEQIDAEKLKNNDEDTEQPKDP